MRRLLAALLLIVSLSACDLPFVEDPANWDPTMYCKMFPDDCRTQGPEDAMTCRTPDGHVFVTGQKEALKNGWICDHAGMGEG